MLLKILPETKQEVDHHVCSIIGVGPIGDKLSSAGIPVHYLDLSHSLDISIIPKLKRLITDLKPEVLITYLPHADLLGRIIGKASGVPTIVGSVRVRLTRSKYLPYFIIDGLTSPLVNHYHFNSKTIASIHHKILMVPYSKITVIPNAIDVSLYDIPVDIAQKKKELGLPDNKLIIGCIARLRKQKGHSYLISAFYEAQRQRPDTTLVLVGDGEEKKSILHEINKRNLNHHVIMLGNRHDVPEILHTFDIFAFTTLYEGMSNSIMEAMASTRTILTTDIPENRELIKHNQTGLLVPARDINKTAQALVYLIDHQQERQRMATNAYHKVLSNFDIDAIVPKYKQFYLSL
jgi:glycosyltransferase involved in cell wall biosynthesis